MGSVRLDIVGRHLDVTPAIKEYATAKLGHAVEHWEHVGVREVRRCAQPCAVCDGGAALPCAACPWLCSLVGCPADWPACHADAAPTRAQVSVRLSSRGGAGHATHGAPLQKAEVRVLTQTLEGG